MSTKMSTAEALRNVLDAFHAGRLTAHQTATGYVKSLIQTAEAALARQVAAPADPIVVIEVSTLPSGARTMGWGSVEFHWERLPDGKHPLYTALAQPAVPQTAITIEMRKAGQEAVWDFYPDEVMEDNEEVAVAAFLAMSAAATQQAPNQAVPQAGGLSDAEIDGWACDVVKIMPKPGQYLMTLGMLRQVIERAILARTGAVEGGR